MAYCCDSNNIFLPLITNQPLPFGKGEDGWGWITPLTPSSEKRGDSVVAKILKLKD